MKAVNGTVTFVADGAPVRPLAANARLSPGESIVTGAGSTADLTFEDSGTALRLTPGTKLDIARLDKESIGGTTVTETELKLVSGAVVGSQRKLLAPSTFNIHAAAGTATIRGTEYLMRADGAVTVLSGVVSMNYESADGAGPVKVTVPAGGSLNPATRRVAMTGRDEFPELAVHVADVARNAGSLHAGVAVVGARPDDTSMSPTHGNNGVGNGVDPAPPGNPPVNDGSGTGPGNPGNKGGKKGG